MKFVFVLSLLLHTWPKLTFAATTTAKPLKSPLTCNVRLSNASMTQGYPTDVGQAYCTGTLIDSSTIVTAAHCLNAITFRPIKDAKNVDPQEIRRFEMAVNDSKNSIPVEIQAGTAAIFTGQMLEDHLQRENFKKPGAISAKNNNLSLINDDLAIIRLSKGAPLPKSTKCPRLPQKSDCEKFNSLLAKNQIDKNSLHAFFYGTKYEREMTWDKSAGGQPALLSLIHECQPSGSIEKYKENEKELFLMTSFAADSNLVTSQKGDSGASLLWSNDGDEVIVGVQSSTSGDSSRSLIAFTCDHLADPRWSAVVNPTNASSSDKVINAQTVSPKAPVNADATPRPSREPSEPAATK